MFEINLVKKPGIQSISNKTNEGKIIENKKSIKFNNYNPRKNTHKKNYFSIILLSIVTVLLFLLYIYKINMDAYNENYEKISISNTLSVFQENSDELYLKSFLTNSNEISFTISFKNEEVLYEKQALLDSLLNTTSFAIVNDYNKNININFNWYIENNKEWNIKKLNDEIRSLDFIDSQFEIYKEKIIFISDLNDLIILFNVLQSYKIDHLFHYKVDIIDDYNEYKKNYYKVIINN